MHSDLQKLITLQHLDSAAADAHKRLADEPDRLKALDARLDAARQAVATAKERLAANQAARREIEKDVAVHQGRLSKFREQAMAVKTNQEYHAIQHEIAFAQTEIKKREDQILELMLAADDLNAAVKKSDAALAAEQKAVDADRQKLTQELSALKGELQQIAAERLGVVSGLTPHVLSTFELIAKRRGGIAIAEARDGMCTECHVRLRPQVFNTVRRNEEILQCDSCNRILYFVPLVVAPIP
jgi:predicted  nucleic acid-binding Zn-ribbon protein